MATPPDKSSNRNVVDQAAPVSRNRSRNDDRTRHFTEGALVEQVCGVERNPVDIGDGWRLMGRVMDLIVGVELGVLCRPGQTIRLREIVEPPPPEPEPPRPESFLPPKPKRRFSPVSEWNLEDEQWREWTE
jgi:hypothetical protein